MQHCTYIHTLWNLCCQHKYHRQLLFLCPKLQTLCDIFCEKKKEQKKCIMIVIKIKRYIIKISCQIQQIKCPVKFFCGQLRWLIWKSPQLSLHVQGTRIPESGKILLVESEILGFEIWNPNNDWNSESKFYRQILESSTLNSRIHSAESRIQDCLGFLYMGRQLSWICATTVVHQECDKQEVDSWIFLMNPTSKQDYI